ncbi:hypothetical protein [Roseibium algae]|uniref:Uncharacterized protein n=1 Tax=Roseibium algae TaxID=3123038 RepID=A0ABU8TGD7_9HYPH
MTFQAIDVTQTASTHNALDAAQSALCSGYLRKRAAQKAAGDPSPTEIEKPEVDVLLRYLGKTREKAETIRANSPAGSYLDGALTRTIASLNQEISQLRYLLKADENTPRPNAAPPRRMRPAN